MVEGMNKNEQRPSARTERPSAYHDAPKASRAASASSTVTVGDSAAAAGGSGKDNKGRKKLFVIIAILIVLAIAAVGLGIWWFGAGGSDFYDANANSGQAPYKTEEEIQAELNRVVEEGMLNISIASVIEFESGTSPGIAYIENSPANHYIMTVTITLDDTGEVIYQSRGIKPDTFIETITLANPLPAGNYPATATFTAYDMGTLEEEGQAAARITISVFS